MTTTLDVEAATLPTCDVRTGAGVVRGELSDIDRTVTVFRGISYAQPPVGPFRFAAPQPVTAWRGARDATRFGPAVPQAAAGRRGSGIPADTTVSDDYLTLNVWTPDLDGTRPVMVWIHGGAYLSGGTTNPVFDGTRLAVDGDVVVVTVNHRVGMEGYAEIAGAPSNRALLDVIAGLEWVRDNIAAFGGNPDSVTIFGQSAGAGAVAFLLAAPAAAGLFHRAIAQSVPGTFLSPELAADVTHKVADELGCAATLPALAQIDPIELAEAADRVGQRMRAEAARWGVLAETATPFSPVIDGDVIPCDPWTAITEGTAHPVPLIVGHTRDEFKLMAEGEIKAHGVIGDDEARRAVELFGPGDVDSYYALLERTGVATDPATVFETVNADWLFRMPSAQLAQVRAAAGVPAYLFEFAYAVPVGGGAPHAADNPMVFGNFRGGTAPRYYLEPVAAETQALSELMRRGWADFAHTGDPGWDPFSDDDRHTMVFDAESRQQPYPHAQHLTAYHRGQPEILPLLP